MTRALWIVVLAVALSGCTTYERKVPPFKMPESLSNVQEVYGVTVAARSYPDAGAAKKAFGFDIVGSGLLPIQVVFDNRGQDTLSINPSQTFLIDEQKNVWPVLPDSQAYERLSESTEMGEIAKGAVKPGILGAAAGAIIGAAVGVVSGENVAEAAGKGAAVGAAAGVLIGGGTEAVNKTAEEKIGEDLKNRALQNRKIKPNELCYGFIFFPAEVKAPRELRLQLKARADSAETLYFPLVEGTK